jgi:hypothetical protein
MRTFKDKYFQAIYDSMNACSYELVNLEIDYGTFPKAWKKCDEARLFGWLLNKLSQKHDYYRRASLSVLSQILYEDYLRANERIEEFTDMLDRISEGDDTEVFKARQLGRKLNSDLSSQYFGDGSDVCFESGEITYCALQFLLKRGDSWILEDTLHYCANARSKKWCDLIRKMVERPTIEEIKACRR